MGQRFTTDDVAANERLDYWRDAICDVFVQLECRSANRRGFFGAVSSETLERLALSVVDADAQHVVRGRRQLARANEDDFLLSFQTEGVGLVRQDGRDALLAPGAMALYASTRPYELVFPRKFRQVVLQLPRALLSPLITNPDALTASTLLPVVPETRLLASSLAALHGNAASLAPASRTHVASSLVCSLAAALAALPQAQRGSAHDLRLSARERIGAYVAAHLDETDLSPGTIATALGYSRQHVHRLFANEDESLERMIWRLRLERVRADLTDPAFAKTPIAELCARRGFASPEHFSRAFRARFGTTALTYRRRAHASGARPSPDRLLESD